MSEAFTKEQMEALMQVVKATVKELSPAEVEVAQEAGATTTEQPNGDLAVQIKQQAETLNKLTEFIENLPTAVKAGYSTDDGGDADPQNKSFGDFLLAIKRRDTKRLATVYGSRKEAETKDIQIEDGTAGGYIVPEEYHARLMEVAAPMAVVRPRATVIPVATDAGMIPALDQYTAPSAGAGDTAFAGGVTLEWTSPGGTLTETQPTFAQIEYHIRKLAGHTEVENEVISDSPFAIEALLTRLFSTAVAGAEDHAFLRGNGVGKPFGILTALAASSLGPTIAVSVDTNATFAYADAVEMRSRFKSVGGQPTWAIHPGIWPDIGAFEVASGSSGVWQANLQGPLGQQLLGYPITESEHLPQDDNAGCVILGDFSAYLILDRRQMAIAFSEHAAFLTDKGTWRVTKRLDGQPWMKNAITLADPQGSFTISPFVYLND